MIRAWRSEEAFNDQHWKDQYVFLHRTKKEVDKKSFSVYEYIVNTAINILSQYCELPAGEKLMQEANYSSLALYLETRSRTLKKDKGEERTSKDCLL